MTKISSASSKFKIVRFNRFGCKLQLVTNSQLNDEKYLWVDIDPNDKVLKFAYDRVSQPDQKEALKNRLLTGGNVSFVDVGSAFSKSPIRLKAVLEFLKSTPYYLNDGYTIEVEVINVDRLTRAYQR